MIRSFRWFTLLRHTLFIVMLAMGTLFLESCDKDDPEPVNEEEVITTVEVTLVPDGNGMPVTLKFFDADGEQGSIAPLITVSSSLKAGTTYSAGIELSNETVNPPLDITSEVADEADDHLFCFNVSGDIAISYEDEDQNGLPIGLLTTWQVGAAGDGQVTLSLRHQAGIKTGECPGGGDTDVEITFDVPIN